VEKMNDDDRLTVKKLIDAFSIKGKLKQLVLQQRSPALPGFFVC